MKEATELLLPLVLKGSRVFTDTRMLVPGGIFFALRGENFNGNAYAAEAICKGCRLAVIDDPSYNTGEECLLVEDALLCLQELSKSYRRMLDMPVLGITGTNGKTTTKELCQAVLEKKFTSQATEGNLNNHIGVPLTLLSLKKTTELAVIEMGANHVGEIGALADLAMPTHALITNIGKAHLEGFGSVENIAKAKGELFQSVIKARGYLFVNGDDPRLKDYSKENKAVTFGSSRNFCCSGSITASFPFVEVTFSTNKEFGKAAPGIMGTIKSQLTGDYNFGNIMAAITIGLFFGVPADDLTEAIEAYVPRNNRSQFIKTASNTVLLDAYNANPSSMEAALSNFSRSQEQPKAVMLGDMLELGKDAEHEHRKIMRLTEDFSFQFRLFVGKHFSGVCQAADNVRVFDDVGQAGEWLRHNPLKDHNILVKGSRGISMEKLLEYL